MFESSVHEKSKRCEKWSSELQQKLLKHVFFSSFQPNSPKIPNVQSEIVKADAATSKTLDILALKLTQTGAYNVSVCSCLHETEKGWR